MGEIKHLLPRVHKYFKTNIHSHSNISDGRPSPEELKKIYKDKGYSVLSITDHNIIVDHSALNDEDFLLLTGAEYNINEGDWAEDRLWTRTYHLNFIAKRPDILWQPFVLKSSKEVTQHYLEKVTDGAFPYVYDVDNINAMIAEANRQGFLVMYNHPTWSLQSYPDYAPLEGLWAQEIINYDSSRAGSGDRDNARVYADLLNLGKRIFPVGADDFHSVTSACGAWIMVGAEKLTYESIIDALEKGDFYASNGPEIHELSITDGNLHVKCSDAQYITLESGTRYYKRNIPTAPDKLLREATFDINKWLTDCCKDSPRNWLRVVVHGPYGNFATSRAYWLDELK